MGFGSHHLFSPRMCFSTEDYNEWINNQYHKTDDDDEKVTPNWF